MTYDLGDFLDREVYPALFKRLDLAFPEYRFRRLLDRWQASDNATRALPGAPRPDHVDCYPDRPWGLVVHGGGFVRFLDLVNGGVKPNGADFVDAVRKLAGLAGVSMPQHQVTREEAERHARRYARRAALAAVVALCRRTILSDEGENARNYLASRGLDQSARVMLEIGLYPSAGAVESAIHDAGLDAGLARSEGLIFERMEGYAVFPWSDAAGHPMTLHGLWPAKTPPPGKPDVLSLPGEGSKASPLYFDRAKNAGLKDLVLVEGIAEAALLQADGEANVIACLDSQLSASQLETLERNGVRSVTICLQPDGAGEKGTLACIKGLHEKGIDAFVAAALPDGKDAVAYVLAHGLDAWRKHIGQATHAFRYKARAILRTHKGAGWTDRSLAACMDEAIAFDATQKDPERLTDLASFFWPEILQATGAEIAAVNMRRDAARVRLEDARERRAYDELLRSAGDKLRGGDLAATKDLLREETERLRTQERRWRAEPVRNVVDELRDHGARLSRWHGRQFIGLPQCTLPTLDALTLGLRGLVVLAAAPNLGKTALAVQLGLDAVVNNKDAAFLFVSLEMSRWDILTRLRSRLSGLDWTTLVFGSGNTGAEGQVFTKEELERLAAADKALADVGSRMRILDNRNFPAPTLPKVLDQLEDLKASSGASRTFVLVDYLQVWPVPAPLATYLRTDLDADAWRIGQMKELRDAVGSENAVLAISEARPHEVRDWTGGMGAVMGAARATYTPDMILLLGPVSGKEASDDKIGGTDTKVHDREAEAGICRQRLLVAKGRDGVQQGCVDLLFHFRQSRYEEV